MTASEEGGYQQIRHFYQCMYTIRTNPAHIYGTYIIILIYNYLSAYTPRGATTDSFCNGTQSSHTACTSITKHSEFIPGQKKIGFKNENSY